MKSNISKQYGIGLIEIMVALVVVAVGILGIAKLQSSVVRSASDANARAFAAKIAQNKIDELRSFSELSDEQFADATTVFSYSQITDDTTIYNGNHTIAGVVTSGAGAGQMGNPDNTIFTLTWDLVGNYFYDNTSPLTLPAASNATEIPDFKVVDVNVSWTDIDGESVTYTMRTIIDGYAPSYTALTGNSTLGSNPPIIPYTPKQAPDVIPVTLGTDDGLKKETAKPLPDVSKKGASTSVQFSSVTYNQAKNTVKREDFKTVACLCTSQSSSPTSTYWKGETVWDAEDLKLTDIAVSASVAAPTLKTGVDNSGGELQDIDCDVCCRDSPDIANPVYSPALDANDIYKACRLKRIDGIYRLYDPWKMIAFNLVPASYFNASAAVPTILSMNSALAQANIDTYSSYVTSLVRERAALTEAAFTASGVDTSFAPDDFQGADGQLHRTFNQGASNNRQLQARAVFMDYPPAGIYTECASCAAATFPDVPADFVPLDRVSFVEVNLTELAGWNPDRNQTSFPSDYTLGHDDVSNTCVPISAPARNYVTNDAIENGCETSVSRGDFYPLVSASEAISTIIYTSNDGVVDKKVDSTATTIEDNIQAVVN